MQCDGECSSVPKAFYPEVMPIARPHIALTIAGHMSMYDFRGNRKVQSRHMPRT